MLARYLAVARPRFWVPRVVSFSAAARPPVSAWLPLLGANVCEVKILMRLPDGRNVATRQAVHGSAPCARTEVLALFAVGDVYVSLCKKSAYAPFSAR